MVVGFSFRVGGLGGSWWGASVPGLRSVVGRSVRRSRSFVPSRRPPFRPRFGLRMFVQVCKSCAGRHSLRRNCRPSEFGSRQPTVTDHPWPRVTCRGFLAGKPKVFGTDAPHVGSALLFALPGTTGDGSTASCRAAVGGPVVGDFRTGVRGGANCGVTWGVWIPVSSTGMTVTSVILSGAQRSRRI